MTPDGVRLRLPVSHAQLAQIVTASRPTVSTALGDLRRAGLLAVEPRGSWVLRGSAPRRLYELEEKIGLQPA